MKIQTNQNKKSIFSTINWRLFFLILAMVSAGLLLLIPYGLTISGQKFSIDLVPDLAGQFVIQLLLYSILIIISLLLGNKTGLGAPFLEKVSNGNLPTETRKSFQLPVLGGLAAGALMIAADLYLFVPRLEAQLQVLGETVRPPAWQGFLASFYGGIVEEVLTRFFLLTFLAWLGSFISRGEDGRPSVGVLWTSILISGLVFGLAHLPTLLEMGVTLTPLYIIRTLVLNAVGVFYGWLYWKRGLSSAMAAHFSTDLIIHVLGALLLG